MGASISHAPRWPVPAVPFDTTSTRPPSSQRRRSDDTQNPIRASPQTDHARSIALADMDRIAIIGCGGSGKTTIGRHLGELLGVQVTHLDVVYYDDDWNTLTKEKFAAI